MPQPAAWSDEGQTVHGVAHEIRSNKNFETAGTACAATDAKVLACCRSTWVRLHLNTWSIKRVDKRHSICVNERPGNVAPTCAMCEDRVLMPRSRIASSTTAVCWLLNRPACSRWSGGERGPQRSANGPRHPRAFDDSVRVSLVRQSCHSPLLHLHN